MFSEMEVPVTVVTTTDREQTLDMVENAVRRLLTRVESQVREKKTTQLVLYTTFFKLVHNDEIHL